MQQNGPFKSLDEVLEVEGFRDDYLQELCRRILTNKLSKPRVGVLKSNRFFKQLLEPEIDNEFSNVRFLACLALIGNWFDFICRLFKLVLLYT